MSSSPPQVLVQSQTSRTKTKSWLLPAFVALVLPVFVSAVLYRLDEFEPVHFPSGELSRHTVTVVARNPNMRKGSQGVAEGEVKGPEDLVYDEKKRVIYTGCEDGWIKRVTVNESVVNELVNTGGRPLGFAFGKDGELIVADAYQGLLRVNMKGEVELLTNEAEGLKFKLTDGVDVADDGTIYFTDASYKYSLHDFYFDVVEGKPHGRFMSYNPATKKTTVLARNLYFPNGVAVSPDQHSVIFCETVLRRCRRYYIEGPKKGTIGKFCHDLPGMPDNIHYVGQGQYYIAIASSLTPQWDLALRYPFIRKAAAMVAKYVGRIHMEKNGGVVAVDLEGNPTAHYYDPKLALISSGIKIGNHMYCGSLLYPFVLRLNIKQHPALPTT